MVHGPASERNKHCGVGRKETGAYSGQSISTGCFCLSNVDHRRNLPSVLGGASLSQGGKSRQLALCMVAAWPESTVPPVHTHTHTCLGCVHTHTRTHTCTWETARLWGPRPSLTYLRPRRRAIPLPSPPLPPALTLTRQGVWRRQTGAQGEFPRPEPDDIIPARRKPCPPMSMCERGSEDLH